MRGVIFAVALVVCSAFITGCYTTGHIPPRTQVSCKAGAVNSRELAKSPELCIETYDIDKSRQLVKSAELSLETYELNKAVTGVRKVATKYDAIIEQANIREGKNAFIKLLVPPDKLDAAIESLKKCGSEIECSVYSQDVTDEVNDLNAVIKNKKALRDRLRKLLDKAQTIDDILKLEKELTRLQTEIDELDTQLAHYKAGIKYSEVSISIAQKRILGPVGYAFEGVFWLIGKLFVIN